MEWYQKECNICSKIYYFDFLNDNNMIDGKLVCRSCFEQHKFKKGYRYSGFPNDGKKLIVYLKPNDFQTINTLEKQGWYRQGVTSKPLHGELFEVDKTIPLPNQEDYREIKSFHCKQTTNDLIINAMQFPDYSPGGLDWAIQESQKTGQKVKTSRYFTDIMSEWKRIIKDKDIYYPTTKTQEKAKEKARKSMSNKSCFGREFFVACHEVLADKTGIRLYQPVIETTYIL